MIREIGKKCPDVIDWDLLCQEYQLPEDFIKVFLDKLKPTRAIEYQQLSEQFIEEQGLLRYRRIAACQKLSEQFIERHQDELDWGYISGCQDLSPEFVAKHIDKITDGILTNMCYTTYPDSLKLLLKQKFAG
jgi:hypothetical protein